MEAAFMRMPSILKIEEVVLIDAIEGVHASGDKATPIN